MVSVLTACVLEYFPLGTFITSSDIKLGKVKNIKRSRVLKTQKDMHQIGHK